MVAFGARCSRGGGQREVFDGEGRGRGWIFDRRSAVGNEFWKAAASKGGKESGNGCTVVELKVKGEAAQIYESEVFADLELWVELVLPNLAKMVVGGDLFQSSGGWSTATKPP